MSDEDAVVLVLRRRDVKVVARTLSISKSNLLSDDSAPHVVETLSRVGTVLDAALLKEAG